MLTIGQSTILSRIVAALDLAGIAISANGDPTRFAPFASPVLSDGSFAGARHVGGFAATIGTRRVDFLPATCDPLLNVNTPADLEVARSRADHSQAEDDALG